MLGAGGAWGAALIALRAARYQADRQAESQHEQWLRQVRRETYSTFLDSADRSLNVMFRVMAARALPADDDGDAELRRAREAAGEAQKRFLEATAALRLVAPGEIREKAAELVPLLGVLFHPEYYVRGHGGQEDDFDRGVQVSELVDEVQRLCRDSLTDRQ